MRRIIVAPLALLCAALLGGVVMAETVQDVEARNKAIVAASFDAWHAGTGSPYDLLADDAIWTIVGRSLASKTYEGREAFMREVIWAVQRPHEPRPQADDPQHLRRWRHGDRLLRRRRYGARCRRTAVPGMGCRGGRAMRAVARDGDGFALDADLRTGFTVSKHSVVARHPTKQAGRLKGRIETR